MESLVLSKPLPFSGSLMEFANLKSYLETPDGSGKHKSWRFAVKIYSILAKAVFVLPVLMGVLVYLALPYHKLSNAIIIAIMMAITVSILLWLYSVTYYGFCRRNYANGCWKYADTIANLVSNILGTYYYIFPNYNVLFYDENVCCYIDAVNGQSYGLNKSNIKHAALEHVHLGSTITTNTTTTGSATAWTNSYATINAKSKSVTHTTSQYEWRLDIFSNYPQCPNLTVVFPDNAEDSAKRAYALLMNR